MPQGVHNLGLKSWVLGPEELPCILIVPTGQCDSFFCVGLHEIGQPE